MRVLVLSHLFPNRFQPVFGVFVYELTKHLADFCSPEVIAPVPWCPSWSWFMKHYPFCKLEKTDTGNFCPVYHARYILFPFGIFSSLIGYSYYFSLKNFIKAKDYDIIHAHQPYPDGYAGLCLKKKTGKPLVVTVHGDVLIKNILQSPALRRKVKSVFANADAIIVVASYQKDFCKELGVDNLNKVIHIPNGADIKRFHSGEDKLLLRQKLSLPVDKKIVIFVGHLYKPKGLFVLLESLTQSPLKELNDTFQLVILGDGYLRRELQIKCSESGIKNVNFIGARTHQDVPLWLSAADIFVLPSLQEGFPTVIPEALASGLPVISTTVGGISDAVNSSDIGILVPPGNSSALSEALASALGRYWNHKTIAEYAFKYDWSNIAESTYKVYETILKGKNYHEKRQ